MKVALYSKGILENNIQVYMDIINCLTTNNIELVLHEDLQVALTNNFKAKDDRIVYKNYSELIRHKVDFMISIGGDGSFLNTLLFVKDSNIPVLGFNIGRLGFLANNSIDEIDSVIQALINNKFIIESRSVIELETSAPLFKEDRYALNDFTIHKRDNSSLTAITTYLNGEFFNKYWGDGLIVATPTGSTAYSMSCGGPIVYPEASNFVITPVAPHNLNVRPVIVPDNVELSFEINSREGGFLISLDSRYKIVDETYKLKLKKAPFNIQLVRLNDMKFSDIIREKLNWGIDSRNV